MKSIEELNIQYKDYLNKKAYKQLSIILDSDEEHRLIREQFGLNSYDEIYHILKKIPFCKHTCEVCGKPLHIKYMSIPFPNTCSRKCATHAPSRIEKMKKSRAKLDKQAILEKRKQTNLKRYGVEAPQSLNIVKERIKTTCLEKYGAACAFTSDTIKEKIKQTNLERYGVENPALAESVKEKAKLTNLRKYGFTSTALAPEVRAKQQKTLLERYGTTNLMAVYDFKNKITIKRNDKTYKHILDLAKTSEVEPCFSREEFKGGGYENIYKWRCKKCGTEFEHYYMDATALPTCRTCNPKKFGDKQCALYDYIKSIYTKEITTNNRKIIAPRELDIYIPDLKLAIEFNGTYWHSSAQKDKNYHLSKTELCENKGIHLIHIYEHLWDNKPNIIKERLKNLLAPNKPVYGRNCIVEPISKSLADEFLNAHHLQGTCQSKVNLGLFKDKELIAVMTFGKPRFNKNYQWELLRYATLQKVLGGANKLLKYFEVKYKPINLISYADRSWSRGDIYKLLGFSKVGCSKPNYLYVYNYRIYSRYQCQKSKLKELLGDNFDPNKTEQQNMLDNKYFQLYDSGQLIFEKQYNK